MGQLDKYLKKDAKTYVPQVQNTTILPSKPTNALEFRKIDQQSMADTTMPKAFSDPGVLQAQQNTQKLKQALNPVSMNNTTATVNSLTARQKALDSALPYALESGSPLYRTMLDESQAVKTQKDALTSSDQYISENMPRWATLATNGQKLTGADLADAQAGREALGKAMRSISGPITFGIPEAQRSKYMDYQRLYNALGNKLTGGFTSNFYNSATSGIAQNAINSALKSDAQQATNPYIKSALSNPNYNLNREATTQNKVASTIGNIGGTVVAMEGGGKALEAASAIKGLGALANPVVRNTILGGGMNAVNTAANGGSPRDILLNTGIGAATFGVGTKVGSVAGNAAVKALTNKGASQSTINLLSALSNGFGFMGAQTAIGEGANAAQAAATGQKYKPDVESIVTNGVTTLLFGAMDGFKTNPRAVEIQKRMNSGDPTAETDAVKFLNEQTKTTASNEQIPASNEQTKAPAYNGMGAADSGTLGGVGTTKKTRFPVNDQLDVNLNELPTPSNRVNMNPQPKTQGLKQGTSDAYTALVDNIHELSKFDKATGGNAYVTASNSRNADGIVSHIFNKNLVDANGEVIGKAFNDIIKPIPKNQQSEFWDYMAQRHNINRAVVDKNVIANYNSKQSEQYVKNVEAKHPEYKQIGDDVVNWIDTFEKEWGVKSGLISNEIYNNLRVQYPNYFPTQREFTEVESALSGGSVGQKFVDQKSTLKKAEGSARDINNPVENIMNLVNTTVKTAKYNQVGQEVLKAVRANPEKAAPYAEIISPEEAALAKGTNVVTVRENGQEVNLRINSKPLLMALEGLPKPVKAYKAPAMITQAYKSVITQKNPFFGLRNFARDLPTGYIYGSQDNPIKYVAGEAKAFKGIATNSPDYQRYRAVGGGMSGFFSAGKMEKAALDLVKGKNVFQKAAEKVEAVNNAIEEATRLNEFNAVYKKTGDVQKALDASNNVTVNFARGGNVTKFLDKNGVAYLNASVQGLDRMVKAFKDPKTAIRTLTKAGLSVTAPTVALYLINMNNPNYKDLSDRTKDGYFVIPNEFGDKDKDGNPTTFIKIPKSREFGILFGSLFERAARAKQGDPNAFKGYAKAVRDNFAPANPFENNIAAPIVFNLPSNKDFAGRTIVPQSLQDRSPSLQYDEKTSELSKFIGKLTKGMPYEISPKQLDYLIDSYTGVIGDFLLPATTKGGKVGNVVSSQYIADSVYSNQSLQNFYDAADKATRAAADRNVIATPDTVTPEEKLSSAYAKSSKDISALGKISTRAGVGSMTKEDLDTLKEYGITNTLDVKNLQRQIRAQQVKIAQDALSRGQRNNEQELDIYRSKDISKSVNRYMESGVDQTSAYNLYKSIDDLKPENGKQSVSSAQKVDTILNQKLTDSQKTALVGSLFTTHDKEDNVKDETLLPKLNAAPQLVSMYTKTKDSAYISMVVPYEFEDSKKTYTLTSDERKTFETAYVDFFNSHVNASTRPEYIKAYRDAAYTIAKRAVITKRTK